MKTLTQLSTIALGLAAAVYAANPVLEAQEGNTLLIDNFEDGDHHRRAYKPINIKGNDYGKTQ